MQNVPSPSTPSRPGSSRGLFTRAARVRGPLGWAAVVVAVLLGAIGFLPLFGGPGYEHALASGLVVPSGAAIAAALDLSARRAPPPIACLRRGVEIGLVLAGVAFATALAHGLRVGFCDLAGGARGFVLTAGVGAVLGGAWGAYVAERARGMRRRRLAAVLLALSAPLLGVAVSVWRFYTSPMIFAFDPFVGYFSGTLYDTVIDAGPALLTYRAGTLATLVFAATSATLLARDGAGRLRVAEPDAGSGARAAVAGLALATSLAVTACGPALGHWQTTATIERELGGHLAVDRCDLVFPDTMRPDEVRLLGKDCNEELASVEKALGARGPERVKALFFRDAGEKKRLMGAGDTYIAKPWRKEVYLQVASYPHPVLGHELAHVVSGSFGRGPFRIAGEAGGWIPNPGLIEGMAVAASPDDDELTDEAWARALLDMGALPPMRQIFSVDFLGQSAAKSYTLAGAFMRWLLARYGADRVRALYGGAPIEDATGQGWDALDRAFREHVASVPLPPEAASFARAKFQQPSVFRRRCPHVVDALRRQADGCRDAHQIAKAVDLYGDVLRRDPHDFAALYGLGLIDVHYVDAARGLSELERLASSPETPRTWQDRAKDALADVDWLDDRGDAAAARYRDLASRSLDEDVGRTLEVKAMAAIDPAARRAVRTLLLGDRGRLGGDPLLGMELLGAWAEATRDPLADYLVGKNVPRAGWYGDAATHLDRALASGLPTARTHREALRQRAVAACALGDAAGVDAIRRAIAAPSSPFASSAGGRLASLERLIDRCRVQ